MAVDTGNGGGGTKLTDNPNWQGPVVGGTPPAAPPADKPVESNTREAAAYLILDRLGAPKSLVYFMVAWMEGENGAAQAKYNNPLNVARPNVPDAYKDGISGTHAGFIASFSSLQIGCLAAVGMLTKPGRYTPLLTAMRVGNEAGAAAALGASGWCIDPDTHKPCPGYGGRILAKAQSYRANSAKWDTSRNVPAGLTYVVVGPIDPGKLGEAGPGLDISAPDWASSLGSALSWLTSADNWRKVGLVALGAVFAVTGAAVIIGDTKAADLVKAVG